MAKKSKMLPTSEFSQMSGISVSTLNKWIRDKKIKAKKQSGKWMIGEDQLKAEAVQNYRAAKPAKTATGAKKKTAKSDKKLVAAAKKSKQKVEKLEKATAEPAIGGKAYTIGEFSALTYLTDFGVREFLKNGRLKGAIDSSGNWQVAAENLMDPLIKHLVR